MYRFVGLQSDFGDSYPSVAVEISVQGPSLSAPAPRADPPPRQACRVRDGPSLVSSRRSPYATGRSHAAPGQPVEPASPLPAASSSTHPPVPHHRLRPRGSATHCLWQGFHTVAVVGGGALDAVGLGAGTLNARALMCGSAKCGSSKCGRLKCGSARSGGATCPSNEHSVLPGRTEEAAGAEIDV